MSLSGERHGTPELIQSTVVTYDDRPDECTLHPLYPGDEERTTAWITALEGSYIDLTAWC